MFDKLFERCSKVLEEKVDYDKLRAQILIMLNDPRTNDEKIYRVLGREYDRQTISHVLDIMRKEPKKVGPLENKENE